MTDFEPTAADGSDNPPLNLEREQDLSVYFSQLYDLLHDIARKRMQGQNSGHTLQPTALLHEAYVRMSGNTGGDIKSRAHFLRAAAVAMRSALVDHARTKKRLKRNQGIAPIPLDNLQIAFETHAIDMLELHDALDKMARRDDRMATLVELRFFAGCTAQEAANILDCSLRTVERSWAFARSWLYAELNL